MLITLGRFEAVVADWYERITVFPFDNCCMPFFNPSMTENAFVRRALFCSKRVVNRSFKTRIIDSTWGPVLFSAVISNFLTSLIRDSTSLFRSWDFFPRSIKGCFSKESIWILYIPYSRFIFSSIRLNSFSILNPPNCLSNRNGIGRCPGSVLFRNRRRIRGKPLHRFGHGHLFLCHNVIFPNFLEAGYIFFSTLKGF